ncbi:MAG: hypothetical protein LBR21_11120, partial [Propionibacteriaceae bacterium]|nr:hypothetical protein [Propionibacteriaceae bacterium]
MRHIAVSDWVFRPASARNLPTGVAAAFSAGPLTAAVPGNVYDDLLAHGLIPDPYLADNEEKNYWIGHEDWEYSGVVKLDAVDRESFQPPDTHPGKSPSGGVLGSRQLSRSVVELVAEGLDTVADVYVGEQLIASVCDQHRSYRWDVTSLVAQLTPSPISEMGTSSVFESGQPARSSSCAQSQDLSSPATVSPSLAPTPLTAPATPTLSPDLTRGSQNEEAQGAVSQQVLGAREIPIRIVFRSVYEYCAEVRERLGEYPSTYEEPFNYVRKMASNFGWDWGPTVVTAGIWKPIYLEIWEDARLASVRPHALLDSPAGTRGKLLVDVDVAQDRFEKAAVPAGVRDGGFSRAPAHGTQPADGRPEFAQANQSPEDELAVTVSVFAPTGELQVRGSAQVPDTCFQLTEGGASVAASPETSVKLELDVGEVKRWWPHTLGEQPLYRVEVKLERGGKSLDSWESRVGFRDVRLVVEPDDRQTTGSSFGFQIAGKPIFAAGFNWIPNDLLITRVTREDYRARLLDARDAGAVMIRVWGGGIYEKDEFYEICDELGLLVWQDCPFACAAYPESEDFAEQIEAETRDNVARLLPHPSLVMWNGCNENIWGYLDWGWEPILVGRGWGERYYYELLPRVIGELDPYRPYWPGSPFSGWEMGAPAQDQVRGRDEVGGRDQVQGMAQVVSGLDPVVSGLDPVVPGLDPVVPGL